jgi:hypothetical protein
MTALADGDVHDLNDTNAPTSDSGDTSATTSNLETFALAGNISAFFVHASSNVLYYATISHGSVSQISIYKKSVLAPSETNAILVTTIDLQKVCSTLQVSLASDNDFMYALPTMCGDDGKARYCKYRKNKGKIVASRCFECVISLAQRNYRWHWAE